MRTILARSLLCFSTETLFDTLTGPFTLLFDDGIEIETNARETQYSSFAWDFHRTYPRTPLLSKHHVSTIIGNGRLGSNTHLSLLGVCMWAVYDTYVSEYSNELEFRDSLARRVYEITNEIYNKLTVVCEGHTTSLDITDFINVMNYPKIKEANDTIEPTQSSIDKTYSIVRNSLLNDSELANNPIAIAIRGNLVSMDQTLQCVSARGFITDTDSVLFPIPITTGYVSGLRTFYSSFIESRSAAKSLMFSKTPLQQAEYFSRRLQLMSQVVQNLHMGDCGSKEYLTWHVRDSLYENGTLKRKGDLSQLIGKYYLDTDGVLKIIKKTDTHLIGHTIKLRMAIHCQHPDPYGVCSTCFGELSYSIPDRTNLGQICCTSLAQKSSQNVLSVKHLDWSSVVVGITLSDKAAKFLKVSTDKSSYLLTETLKQKQVFLIVAADEASNITDVMEIANVNDLNITRISELSEIGIMVNGHIESFVVSLNQRLASMTTDLLEYIKVKGWVVNERGNYVIDMKDWNFSKEILTLPLKHFSMGDHSADIAKMLESSVGKLQKRNKLTTANSALVELFDLVNDKLNVNLAVLDVVFYASMVINDSENNYGLPKPFTKNELGVMKVTMVNRSLSAAMAFESHRRVITSPNSYLITNRPDHPLDRLLVYHS